MMVGHDPKEDPAQRRDDRRQSPGYVHWHRDNCRERRDAPGPGRALDDRSGSPRRRGTAHLPRLSPSAHPLVAKEGIRRPSPPSAPQAVNTTGSESTA
ncbi:MAG: hypothetical protein F4223_03275 [Rhodobacteraceae bacterium]|nr:hypothetical protein [Paracoccaceae bacterium]